MTVVNLTKMTQNPPPIKQSRLKRDWMDNTYNKHAYRCLPMTTANVHGWELILPQDVVVQLDAVDTVPRILSGEMLDGRPLVIPSILNIVSFCTSWIFKTEPGYSTWISGSPNYVINGAVPLSASIPTDWWPDEFNMNWYITKVGEPIIFEKGTPFMFFNFYKNDELLDTTFTVDGVWEKEDLMKERSEYWEAKEKNRVENPWKWMNGIRTGINEKGQTIGPKHDGLEKLNEPHLGE